MNVSYVRVSSIDQNFSRQFLDVPIDKVFEDKCSGKDTNRPKLQECLAFLRENDILHCSSCDRLARNLFDLLNIVQTLLQKGVTIHFHKENLIFNPSSQNPIQNLYLNILGSVAEFERALIKERQKSGIFLARQRNAYKNVGRKKSLSEEQITEIKSKKEMGVPVSKLAKTYSVSRQTIYELLKTR